MSNLTKTLSKLPKSPGVYMFKNKSGGIIYVGKSGNLKNRVRSYFTPTSSAPSAGLRGASKTKMVSDIADIKIIKTESEIEALIKESGLIKKLKPKFNVLMRDSKNYLFIGFTREEFPKIILTHQPIRNCLPTADLPQGEKLEIRNYVGPFTDANAIKKSLRVLRDIFPYCTCKQKHLIKCLNAHMGKCLGFCCLKNYGDREANELNDKSGDSANVPRDSDRYLGELRKRYMKNINAIKRILRGQSKIVLKNLSKEIKNEIKLQNFEQAVEIKQKIAGMENVLAHAHVLDEKFETSPAIFKDTAPDFRLIGLDSNPERIEMYDISNIQGSEAVGSMVVFKLQDDGNYKPDKNQYRKFRIKFVAGINDPAMIGEVISRRLRNNWPLPQLIILDGGKAQLNSALKAMVDSSATDQNIKVFSLAKRLEEIYVPGKKDAVLAQSLGQSMKHLFMAIRDEAHRFAISYHRKLRTHNLSLIDKLIK